MRSLTFLASLAIAPLLCGATEPLHLQPASSWVVDYADQSCRLIRTFGDGSTKLVFESVAPGEVTLTVTGNAVAAPSDSTVAGKLRSAYTAQFSGAAFRTVDGVPAARWQHVPVIQFDEHDPPKGLWLPEENPPAPGSTRPPAIDGSKRTAQRSKREAILASSDGLEIQRLGKEPLMLETGALSDPVHALDQCDRNLLSDLGVDPDLQKSLARPPWTNKVLTWITPNIYPKVALRQGLESSVTLRLIIDATGKITNCTAITRFAAPEFASAVCAALDRRNFEPAELPDGTKVPSYFISEITFRVAN